MSLTIVLILVVTFAVVIYRLLHRFANQPSLLSGVEYLLIGLVLGPYGADLLSRDVLTRLQPELSLLMGLVGFILGLPLRHRVRQSSAIVAGLVTSSLVATAVAGASYGLVRVLVAPELEERDALWLALAIGAAAATTSGPLLLGASRHLGARGPVTELIRANSVAGDIAGIAVAGVALALGRAHAAADQLAMTDTEWLVASAGLGVACGVLFSIFLGRDHDDRADRTFLATVGIVIFTSGLAAAMGVSPLLLNAVAGVVTSFLYRLADRLHLALGALHVPANTVLMIFAGAMWAPPANLGWLLPLLYLVVRYGALRLAAPAAVRLVGDLPRPTRLGDGLLGQGALAAAIVVNFSQVNPALAPLALTAVLPTLVISGPLSPYGLRTTLADAGELGRVGGEEAEA